MVSKHGLPALAVHSAQGPAGGGGADESVRTLGEGLHSGLVTEDAALADRAGGVHRQHGHLFAQIAQVVAQRLNEGALPRARYAGNAYPDGIPRVGKKALENLLAQSEVLGSVGFNEGNGLGEHHAVSAEDSLHIVVHRILLADEPGRTGLGGMPDLIDSAHDLTGKLLAGVAGGPFRLVSRIIFQKTSS